jgi:hypothetical protein
MPSGLLDFSAGDLTFRVYRVSLGVFGLHLPALESECLRSASFRYSGLHKWISIHPQITDTPEAIQITNRKDQPPLLDVCSTQLRARIQLEMVPHLTMDNSGEYRTNHEVLLRVDSAEPKTLEWFMELARRFENLFSLLLGTSVVLTAISITHEEKKGWTVRKEGARAQKPDMRFWVACSAEQLTEALSNWLSTPPEFRALESLVYGTIRQTSMFVETEFLSLSQALESFARLTDRSQVTDPGLFKQVVADLNTYVKNMCANTGLATRLFESVRYANEPNFRTRMERLIGRLPDDYQKKLLGDVVAFETTLRQTRNCLTHPGIDKGGHVLTRASDLFIFNQKLHALLRLLMLMHIGFAAQDVFEPVWQQANRYRLL